MRVPCTVAGLSTMCLRRRPRGSAWRKFSIYQISDIKTSYVHTVRPTDHLNFPHPFLNAQAHIDNKVEVWIHTSLSSPSSFVRFRAHGTSQSRVRRCPVLNSPKSKIGRKCSLGSQSGLRLPVLETKESRFWECVRLRSSEFGDFERLASPSSFGSGCI